MTTLQSLTRTAAMLAGNDVARDAARSDAAPSQVAALRLSATRRRLGFAELAAQRAA